MKPEDRKQIALIEHCAKRIHEKAEQACKYCYDKFGVENSPDGLLEDIAEMALSIQVQAGNLCASRDAQPVGAQGEPVAWQFFKDGKWLTGLNTHNHRENIEASGACTRDLYPEAPAAAINEPFYSGFISGEQDWQVLKTAVDTWGEYEQVMMAIGECGEFLTLMGRKVQGRLVESDMHDEIADVLIMMHQMANIYGIDHVRARVRHKMEKLAAKLNKAIAAAEAEKAKGGV